MNHINKFIIPILMTRKPNRIISYDLRDFIKDTAKNVVDVCDQDDIRYVFVERLCTYVSVMDQNR